jgi:putative endopeptidase
MKQPIDLSNMDPGISPRHDFYHYANGGWLKKHPIPGEFSRYGTFDKLREDNRKIVRKIIESVAQKEDSNENPIASLTGSFYNTGMDSERINAMGFDPVKGDLEAIEMLRSKEQLTAHISAFYCKSIPTLFYLHPSPDREDSEMIIASLYQGGMGLSDVDYYRNDDQHSREIRQKYLEYIASMFILTGTPGEEAGSNAQLILSMETTLAHAGMTRLEQRDPHKTFNKHSVNELQKLSPEIDWNLFLNELNIDTAFHLNVGQPRFFTAISDMIREREIDEWKAFLKWRVINSAASLLSDEFAETKFDFYGRFLSGKKSMQPRWKRVTAATEDALGEAIGKLFIEKYFPPEAKERMLTLVEHLREALRERIDRLDWMSAETKDRALEKLEMMRVKIGYPEKWRSYGGLTLSNNSYYENYRDAAIFNLKYELSKIGKPADKDEWHMHPHTVNAYYHPLLNEIVFPAGILQPPFFYKDADDAVNYGAIGVVIGHEMTHGFDDQGRKFDKNGNLNDWWTKEDTRNFEARSSVLEEQFNKIRITGDLYADGKLSLGRILQTWGV